jgi:glyoxylase-like metal-dependent hydrolase (beta-lactamase superfamily II)
VRLPTGRIRVDLIRSGTFALDGGAMFGVVPKALWSPVAPPDGRNRIDLALGSLLVRTREDVILVDTGIGDRWSPKEIDIYAIRNEPGLDAALRAAGVGPEEITKVVNTHLHFDHCGGNTRERDGHVLPAFTNARHFVQKGEYDWACRPTRRDRASYRPDDWLPVHDAGRLTSLDGDVEVADGVHVLRLPGHTKHLQGVLVEDGAATVFFPSDLVPTVHHLAAPWIMAFDLEPLVTLRTKVHVLERAAELGWVCVFQHEPATPVGRVRMRDGSATFEAIET